MKLKCMVPIDQAFELVIHDAQTCQPILDQDEIQDPNSVLEV